MCGALSRSVGVVLQELDQRGVLSLWDLGVGIGVLKPQTRKISL